MPKISVIVPVYRAEAYLPDCIRSILSQTCEDFELFLVNDGSPDNCGAICDEYAARDSRIRVIHQENQGQAAARNHAFSRSCGEWVCFVDSDDLIHPRHLELLLKAAEEGDADISMCGMLEAPELPGDFLDDRDGACEVLTVDEQTMLQLYDGEEYPVWVACAKLIRRELIAGYPFRIGRIYEDNEAVCRWVCGGKRLARIRQNLYFYRSNPICTTQKNFSPKRLDYLWALESILRFYSGLGWEEMKGRFTDRYADAAKHMIYAARMYCPEKTGDIGRSVRRIYRQERLRFTVAQKEELMLAMHPKLMTLYWPVAGAVRTLRRQGLKELVGKILRRFGKGDSL